jgi:antitoxin ParD1/3/4
MNIALPESMKVFVLEQVAAGGYSTVSEYVRELIRADQKRKAQQRLETLLLEGLDSGEATPMTRQDWNAIRSRVAGRVKKSRGK